MKNLAVIFLYFAIALFVLFTWRDYVCAFAFGCNAEDTEGLVYMVTGQILVFLNLWLMFFFVNVDFFKNKDIDSSRLAVPVITSTLLGSIVFLAAKPVLMVTAFVILMIVEHL